MALQHAVTVAIDFCADHHNPVRTLAVGMRGAPGVLPPAPVATDPETGRRLWAIFEELTGVRFPLPQPAI